MFHTSLVAGLLAIAPLALGNPVPTQEGQVTAYSISQVPVHGNYARKRSNPAKEYMRSLAKYHRTIPESVSRAAKASSLQSGTVPNSPEANDEEYLAPVNIGTSAQTLMLDFDTGSSDLWVFSNEMPTSQSKDHSPLYNHASGKTENGETWDIMYGDGSGASGNVFADKVVVGGVTATSQAVEAATSVSSTFTADTANDGLLGLGFDNINTCSPNVCQTFFGNVASSLPSELFTATLKHNAAGSYDFGYIDSSKYTGTIAYAPVTTSMGFWQFSAGTYYVGNTAEASLGTAIADTGTSIILVPNSVLKKYYAQVSGAENSSEEGGYIFPCSSTLPSFSVTIGGAKRTTPGTYINYASVGSGYCYGGLQSSQGEGFSILGDVFLKSQYVVFDVGNTRLGMAPQ